MGLRNKKLIFVIISACFYISVSSSFAQVQEDDNDWYMVKSAYCAIYYRPDADLKKIEKRLKKRSFYVAGAPKLDPLSSREEKVAYRLDRIFQRAQEILELRTPKERVKVKIFSTRRRLNETYYRIFKHRKTVTSFYVFKHNTIYTSEADISDSVMSHEIAHSLVDHYFVITLCNDLLVDLNIDYDFIPKSIFGQ